MAKTAKNPYLLTVLTGPNAGAQERLSSGRVTLSGELGADFVLDGLDGPSIQLAIAKDRLRVKSERDDLVVSGKARVAPGVASITALPATLELAGNIQIHLCREAAPKKRKSAMRRLATAALCLVAIGAATLTVKAPSPGFFGEAMASILTPPEPQDVAALEVAPDAQAPSEGELPAQVPVALPTLEDARTEMMEQIKAADLRRLRATIDDGALRVVGTITDTQSDAWHDIRRGYEKRYGQIAPLLAKITEEVEVAPVTIMAIWLGETAEFSTAQGDILRQGDVTRSGWTVTGISATAVRLTRGDQEAQVDF